MTQVPFTYKFDPRVRCVIVAPGQDAEQVIREAAMREAEERERKANDRV